MPRKGYKQSPTHRARRVKKLKGRTLSPRHCTAISEGMKRRFGRQPKTIHRTKIVRVKPHQQLASIPHPSLLAVWGIAKALGCERIEKHKASGGFAALFPSAKFATIESVEPAATALWKMAKKTPYGIAKDGTNAPWAVTFYWTTESTPIT